MSIWKQDNKLKCLRIMYLHDFSQAIGQKVKSLRRRGLRCGNSQKWHISLGKCQTWVIRVPFHSIYDIAKSCGVSVATVTRFTKKLGFGPFKELKVEMAIR